MSAAIKLEVVPEAAQRDGGHAIIRIKGVADMPSNATFRIEPVDDDAAPGGLDGWPKGPLTPMEVRPIDGGYDLLVGPDVVDNANLRAGTPVAIVIDALKYRQELLWPNLTPTISPRRPARVLTMTQSAAMTQALRDAERRQAVVAQLSKGVSTVEQLPSDPMRVMSGSAAASAVASAAASVISDGPGRAAGMAAAASLSALSTGRDRPPPPVAPLAMQATRLQKVEQPVAADTSSAILTAATAAPVDVATVEPDARSYPIAVRDADGYIADYVARRRSNVSLVFGTLALMVASAAAGFAYKSSQIGGGDGSAITTGAVVAAASDRVAVPPSTVFELFKAPEQPGVQSKLKEIDRDASLSLADTLIHSAGSDRDLREAEALLKHGLALSLGDKSTLWALTQLGSLSAQPTTGEPDYQKARLLWEISGALGDPVAMCFLGELHEFGLGVPTNKQAARKWYLQAKQAGGCSTVDAALARIK
jgi:Sel1 repeat